MTDESIFASALEKRTQEERRLYLATVCRDPSQLQRLEELIRAHVNAPRFLEEPAISHSANESHQGHP